MLAGGLGNIRNDQTHKLGLPTGTLLVVLGGPGMRIGIGGGAASSMGAGANSESLTLPAFSAATRKWNAAHRK